ncbi:universal stress protein [Nitratireductor sp. GCM10026969]|uniref:universal stress protein n=1 Tax=Nitratireductor sp. GCM10026969 TaxID=3252645 RepID=UPI0036113DD5
MKTILVPVEMHDLASTTLETAAFFGKTFGSYLEGFPLSPALSPFLAADAMGATIVYDSDFRHDGTAPDEARRMFERTMHAHGVPAAEAESGALRFGWHGEPQGDNFVGSYGRVFDITVVGRPGSRAGQPRASTLEAALFESGRPVLIAPPRAPSRMGETIMIAWNGSTETARTIGFAMPLLQHARRAIVLTVEGSSVPGPTGEEVGRYLRYNGINCEMRSVAPGSRSAGKTILDEAAECGCDLLIKGAFTQSRIRQMIFGGATRQIIAESTLPVFMAH